VDVTNELQRIYDQLKDYEPPDTTGASAPPGLFSKLFGTKQKLDPSQRLKGLYIYGSVGGGKTMLMDMFYDTCTQVSAKQTLTIKININKI
jgi:peroxisome-assembly ATPase